MLRKYLPCRLLRDLASACTYLCLCEWMCSVASNYTEYTGLWLFWALKFQCLANNNTIIPNIQLLTSKTTCHMELFGLWRPEGLGALQTSVFLKGCDSHRPRKERHRVIRQGALTPLHPNFLLLQSYRLGGQETMPKGKGVWQRETWSCIDSFEGLEHGHSTQCPATRRGYGVKFLVQGYLEGLWQSKVNLPENQKSQSISIWEGSVQSLSSRIAAATFPSIVPTELDLDRVCCSLWQPALRIPRLFYSQGVNALAGRRHTHN